MKFDVGDFRENRTFVENRAEISGALFTFVLLPETLIVRENIFFCNSRCFYIVCSSTIHTEGIVAFPLQQRWLLEPSTVLTL